MAKGTREYSRRSVSAEVGLGTRRHLTVAQALEVRTAAQELLEGREYTREYTMESEPVLTLARDM